MKTTLLCSLLLLCAVAISAQQNCQYGNVLTAFSGSFTDGSGSQDYIPYLNCSWLIQPTNARKIFISINLFSTEPGYDTLSIYDGENKNSPLLFAASGTLSTPYVLTNATQGSLFITFTSDYSVETDGFEISYSAESTLGCVDTTFTSLAGVFSDASSDPLNYFPNGTHCVYTIQPFSASSVTQLSFINFDLQDNDANLIVNSPPVVLTGGNVPNPIVSQKGQAMTVSLDVIPGARADFTALFQVFFCYGTTSVTGLNGIITDGSGIYSYRNSQTCIWIIEPYSQINSTAIQFVAFDTERGADFVKVYDGNSTLHDALLISVSGNTVPGQTLVGTAGHQMMIIFQTDDQTTQSGWNISFTRVPGRSSPTVLTSGGSVGQGCSVANPVACQCPDSSSNCELLPDMTSSSVIIEQDHYETPGRLTLSNATPNIGWGPLEIHPADPPVCFCSGTSVSCSLSECPDGTYPSEQMVQTIYVKNGSSITSYTRLAGTVTYHPSHGHIHVDNWASFSLRRDNGDPNPLNWPIIGQGSKVSFCLVNLGDCTANAGYCQDQFGNTLTQDDIPNSGFGIVTGCNRDQGIYVGYLDVYDYSLPGQEIIIPQGTCNGDYYVVSITDPENKIKEYNESNNYVAVPITLTRQTACSGGATTGAQAETEPGASTTLTSGFVTTGTPALECQTFISTDVPKRIPQDSVDTSGDSDSIITVTINKTIYSVKVLEIKGNHTYIGDLDFFIENPSEVYVQLVQRRCDGNQNFFFSFSDSALPGNSPIIGETHSQALYPCPPVGGTWRPYQRLSTFNYGSSKGNWTIHIVDNANGDYGVLISWKLQLCWIKELDIESETPSESSSSSSFFVSFVLLVFAALML